MTVTTDEQGPHALPRMLDGVPLRLRRITVNIDRQDFMINPTTCMTQDITADVAGSENAVEEVSSPVTVAGCRTLAFAPSFSVSTSAHTSRADGASLLVKLRYPPESLGHSANIARVKVSLPKQLPSRLTTLQKACPAAQFEANPASCPAGSIVGIAKALTPLLPVELSGPVYFVSHGGEAFPNLIVVLQGDGVRVNLVADTYINKAGVTSSTFETVPDAPVGTFELYLPEGRDSALAANGNLCKETRTTIVTRKTTRRVHGRVRHLTTKVHKQTAVKLVMPTEFTAHNGATIDRDTAIRVSGCATQTKPSKRAKSATHRGGGKAKRARRVRAGQGSGR